MTSPKRIQRKRTKGWKMPNGAIYVGRPTKWANPYTVAEHGRELAVTLYRAYLAEHPELVDSARRELAGHDLACWCPLANSHGAYMPCHADVLLELARD